MKEITEIDDPRLIKALAHPLRMRILGIMEHQTASPSEIAETLGAPLGNVSYHVRILAEHGLIRLVRRTPRRGAIEHHYEAVGRLRISGRAWSATPEVVRAALLSATLGQISDFVNAAAVAGGFDGEYATAEHTPVTVDDVGFQELAAECLALYERAREIERESVERLVASDHAGEVNVGMITALFNSPHPTDPPASGRAA